MDSEKTLRPILTRVKNMIARAVVKLIDDGKKMQAMQIQGLQIGTSTEVRTVERFQNYGFTSVPLEGAEAVVVYAEGRRDHGIAVVVEDRRYRLKGLQDGEVAIYTDQGDSITIKRGGTIVVNATTVELAGNSDSVAMSSKVDDRISKIWTALSTWVPAPNDGGAALKTKITAITTADPHFPEATGSTKVKLS